MFCPVCRDEFRPGFSRCRACDVDLVESLDASEDGPASASVPAVDAAPVPAARAARGFGRGAPVAAGVHEQAVGFCGFLTLEDARHAKAQLRDEGLAAEILIRDAADGHEEFWLRVKPSEFPAAQGILGYDESSLHEEDTVLCAACETLVPAGGDRCPHCGTPFEEE